MNCGEPTSRDGVNGLSAVSRSGVSGAPGGAGGEAGAGTGGAPWIGGQTGSGQPRSSSKPIRPSIATSSTLPAARRWSSASSGSRARR